MVFHCSLLTVWKSPRWNFLGGILQAGLPGVKSQNTCLPNGQGWICSWLFKVLTLWGVLLHLRNNVFLHKPPTFREQNITALGFAVHPQPVGHLVPHSSEGHRRPPKVWSRRNRQRRQLSRHLLNLSSIVLGLTFHNSTHRVFQIISTCMYSLWFAIFKYAEWALPFKHTYRTGISYYLRAWLPWPGHHIFKCRYRTGRSK